MLNSGDKCACTLISGLLTFCELRLNTLMISVLAAVDSESDFPFY